MEGSKRINSQFFFGVGGVGLNAIVKWKYFPKKNFQIEIWQFVFLLLSLATNLRFKINIMTANQTSPLISVLICYILNFGFLL